ncbi:hypothetical protein, conserved [Eimeria necatrix]|uniref:Uncharacterized protein n=1 Tax=Eimeria necatrix TaxID=51315 RepID=U6MT68_9EIME|nr:hypothetical protein, conserved [Eimeria necatrix]CDJ66283.1 hypothetical protein, conserved [Eimeria necatrix]
MERKGKQTPPLNLPLSGKKDVQVSPRYYEPGSSHRHSVASTGVGDSYSPLFRSPELTYRSSALPSPKAVQSRVPPLPPSKGARQHVPRRDVPRPAVLVSSPFEELPRGQLITPEIIKAKQRGTSLPPLKEAHLNMLDEYISPETANWINTIPPEDMLRLSGSTDQTHDPRFTEEPVQYHLDHPFPPSVLKKYPNYADFPLLLNKVHRPTLKPNFRDRHEVEHLRGHNEAMLESHCGEKPLDSQVAVREAYMHVPNFGRVQVVLTDYPDGTSYPLVTLPKMTPHDILKVLDMQKAAQQRSWVNVFFSILRKISCGLF